MLNGHPNHLNSQFAGANWRLNVWYGLLLLILAIFGVRLFFLQIIQHEHYRKQALTGQLKEYTIPSERGIIEAHEGDAIVPIVLNEKLFTLFADPKYVSNIEQNALNLAKITGGDPNVYSDMMKTKDTRYVILTKKLSEQKAKQIDQLALKGIGTRAETYRTYPQGSLASQILGFVDSEGQGKYGIEQALDNQLRGKEGLLRAITDASGIPLVSNKDNIQIDPIPGKRAVLTIDIGIQRQVEDILKQGLDNAKSQSGSALILSANDGSIKAVANWPTFNPSNFSNEKSPAVFNNPAFSSPLEPGSVMKPFTTAAALELGVVNKDTTYYDPGSFKIDGATVKNIEEDGGAGVKSIKDILQLSLNTGAVWLLQQMGGGDINSRARNDWFDYMSNHYQFGKPTGVEGYEENGILPNPNKGDGLNIQFANTAFGQGMTVTPLQLGAALASVVNGGTYYQPHIIDSYIDQDGKTTTVKPKITNSHVVSAQVSSTLVDYMNYVVSKNNLPAVRAGYSVGGKTGTAQIPKPGGGYFDDKYNGMYIGFVGGASPEYIIVVRINEPSIAGYAGAKAAAPVFASISNMLIDNFGIKSR